jgi:hypothetical protein
MAKDRFHEISQNVDPSARRREDREAPNVKELAARYLSDYAEIHNKPGTAREVRRLLEKNIVPHLAESGLPWPLGTRSRQSYQLPAGLR